MRKNISILFCILSSIFAKAQLANVVIRDLKTGKIKDNITHVYWLPYKTGNRYLFIQGANSSFSHKNELAYDFNSILIYKIARRAMRKS